MPVAINQELTIRLRARLLPSWQQAKMRSCKSRRADPGLAFRQQEAVMRLLALCTATVVTITVSFAVNAADLAYPAPLPQYGVAAPPAAPPPQVIIVPGPTAPPQYIYGAPAAPPLIGPHPHGLPPPVPPLPVGPPVAVAPPSAACPPSWRCTDRGCGWQPTCVPRPEHYSDLYGPPGPRVYPGPNPSPVPGPYPEPYEPQVGGPYEGEPGVYRP